MWRISGIGAVAAAIAIVFMAIGFSLQAQEDSPAHQFCRITTDGGTEVFNSCLVVQIQAAQSIVRYIEWAQADGGAEGQRVLSVMAFCRDRWAPDHRLVDNCLRARALIPPP